MWVYIAVQRPTERYPALGWEVALGGGYLVVGTRFAKDETLGHRYFVSTEGPRPVQRLLVIRASRLAPADAAPEAADAARAPAVPPLALRAVTTIRGTGE